MELMSAQMGQVQNSIYVLLSGLHEVRGGAKDKEGGRV